MDFRIKYKSDIVRQPGHLNPEKKKHKHSLSKKLASSHVMEKYSCM